MDGPDAEYLERLRARSREALGEVIGHSVDVALLDAPNQRNVGDSLIWAGEIEYFEELGLRLRYVADLWTYVARDLRKAMPTGVVLIHGGGNLGDVWEGHQVHRERIAQELHDYKIVQLPQSLYFRSRIRAAQANTVLSAHDDFHILLRETPSMERAVHDLPNVSVSFCPDMALGWTAPPLTASVTNRILAIARADVERSSGLDAMLANWVPGAVLDVTDWHNTGWRKVRWSVARFSAKAARVGAKLRRTLPWVPAAHPATNRLLQRSLTAINRINIAGGVELYEGAQAAVVDRLHAHILATLLDIPNIVLDNNYGKVKSVHDDYTGGFSKVEYVTSLEAAHDSLAAMLGGD